MRGQPQLLSGQRRHFTGHADHRQAAGHVRQHVDLDDDVAHEVGRGHPDRGVLFQQDDAFVLLVDAQLEGRADHRVARFAADLARFQLLHRLWGRVAVEEHGAGHSENHFLPHVTHVDVRRPGDHLLGAPLTVLDRRQLQLVRVRVFFDLDHCRDDDLVTVPNGAAVLGLDAQARRRRQADGASAGDFEAGQSQALDKLGGAIEIDGHVIGKPLERDFHETVSGLAVRAGSHRVCYTVRAGTRKRRRRPSGFGRAFDHLYTGETRAYAGVGSSSDRKEGT